jgi:hypothetical protein
MITMKVMEILILMIKIIIIMEIQIILSKTKFESRIKEIIIYKILIVYFHRNFSLLSPKYIFSGLK